MSPPAILRLEVLGGESVELPRRGTLVVGSSPERAGLLVEGQGVEDAHCAIGRLKRGGWAIQDLGSRFGTLVNGERVEKTRLAPGDRIVLGSRSLRVVDPAAVPPPEEEPAPAGLAEPLRIAGYRVERPLGRGGMGEVLLAVQESLNRPVALKVLSEELGSDREFVLRFHSEARAAAALNHSNVVVVHDVGRADGRHFLSMEYMPGGNLEERVVTAGRLPWREVLNVLHDAACGLTYAESRGIVHRDIKPANLMLAASGAVKIADLGLAIPVSDQDDGTDERRVFATPHFVSPEQARGEVVDHRSDLWSLGATAYRLLTGRTPFSGETTRDIVRARFHEDPIPLRELVPELPPGLAELVERLMARAPSDRFDSAEELRREVDRLRLQADHGEPRPEPATEKETSHRPLLLAALGALVLAAGATAVVLVLQDVPDEGPPPDDGAALAGTGPDGRPAANGGGPQGPDDPDFFAATEDDGAPDDTDEQALRIRELTAEVALRDVPEDLEREERIDALLEVAAAHPGTRAASDARREAEELRETAREQRLAQARFERDLEATLGELRRLAGWPPDEGALPDPARALEALAAFRPAPAVASDPRWSVARDELEAEVLGRSLEALAAELQRAEGLSASGEFEAVAAVYADLVARLELAPTDGDEGAQRIELRRLAAETRARAAALGDRERAFQSSLLAADRAARGRGLGPRSGFSDELAALDLDAARARLDALAAELRTGEGAAPVQALALDLERAQHALDGLVAAFDEGTWRRRTVTVDEEGRPRAHETVGARSDGLLVAAASGPLALPWAAFAEADSIERLFRGRLTRAWSPEEHHGIVTLLRFVGAARAARLAVPGLAPGSFVDPRTLAALEDALDPAAAWLDEASDTAPAGAREALTRDREATSLLAEALLAAQEEHWTPAVAALERLTAGLEGTLVVLLVSDGSPVEEAPVAVPDGPGEDGPEPPEAPENGE